MIRPGAANSSDATGPRRASGALSPPAPSIEQCADARAQQEQARRLWHRALIHGGGRKVGVSAADSGVDRGSSNSTRSIEERIAVSASRHMSTVKVPPPVACHSDRCGRAPVRRIRTFQWIASRSGNRCSQNRNPRRIRSCNCSNCRPVTIRTRIRGTGWRTRLDRQCRHSRSSREALLAAAKAACESYSP